MKIGLSFSLCVDDIVQGKVDIKDVLVIITSTKIKREDLKASVIYYETAGRFQEDRGDEYLSVAEQLWDNGIIHQPREYGIYRGATPDGAHWLDVTPAGISDDPNVLEAWRNYQLLLKLVK